MSIKKISLEREATYVAALVTLLPATAFIALTVGMSENGQEREKIMIERNVAVQRVSELESYLNQIKIQLSKVECRPKK